MYGYKPRSPAFLIVFAWVCGAINVRRDPAAGTNTSGHPQVTGVHQLASSTGSSVDWVTWLMVDIGYLDILECWENWFLRSSSTSTLVFSCLDAGSCAHLEKWKNSSKTLAQMQIRIGYEVDKTVVTVNTEADDADSPQPIVAAYNTVVDDSLGDPDDDPRAANWLSMLETSEVRSLRGTARRNGAGSRTGWPHQNYISSFYPEAFAIMRDNDGMSVLHSDADAFWTKNPDSLLQAMIQAYPDADIIGSHHSEPVPFQVNEAWGFIMNMGFIMFRNTNHTKEFFVKELLNQDMNDQILLNMALNREGCEWNDGLRKSKVGQCGNMKVIALPYSDFSREVEGYNSTHDERTVAHPDTGAYGIMSALDRHIEFEQLNMC